MSLPDRFRTLIVDRAKYYTYMLRSDPQHAQLADRDFQRKLRLLKVDYATKNDYMRSDTIGESIATNIRSDQRSEISEMFESFKDGQKGSSAMPHKKSPSGSERIAGLARIMRSYVSTSLENMVLWNERDISNSSVERIVLPDTFHLISFMSIELNLILKHLVINYEQINVNLEDAKNKSVSPKYLSYLVNNGVDRDTAYRKIQEEIFNNLSA